MPTSVFATLAQDASIGTDGTSPPSLPGGSTGVRGWLRAIYAAVLNIPTQGQALAAASLPVVLPAAQVTTLTPPAAITGFALDATLTGGAQQTKDTDGTSVASNVAGDSGQNSRVVAGARKEATFTTTTAQVQGQTDVSNYRWVSVHILTQGGSSIIQFQQSNDGVAWVSTPLVRVDQPGTSWSVQTSSAAAIYTGPVQARYFRLNIVNIVSGTTAGVMEFFANPAAPTYIYASPSAAAVGGYSYGTVSSATTTTIKSGSGTLHTLTVLGGTLGAITVYDNSAASGTPICPTFTPTAAGTYVFDVAFGNGLTIVTASATVLNVSYK